MVSKAIPGSTGRGREKVVENKCSPGYQPKPTYGTTDYCECVPESVELCQIQGKTCTKDGECQSDPGCGNFVCYGNIAGRRPGTCEEKTNLCPKANLPCANDSDCLAGGTTCANFTCWRVSRNNKQCRLGPEPKAEETTKASEPLKCGPDDKGINTALGCIPVGSTNEFVGWFLRWAIGIAGGVAFILMLIAGFQIMTASGNPEKIQGGKELLNAAISGLVLIVFSVFLLKLIGVDILALPGF